MNERLTIVLVIFAGVLAIEALASAMAWRKKPATARPLLVLAVLQVGLPAALLVLGFVFPPPPSPDALSFRVFHALNSGVFHGLLLIGVVPWVQLLLWAIGLIMAATVFVSLAMSGSKMKPQQSAAPLPSAPRARPSEGAR